MLQTRTFIILSAALFVMAISCKKDKLLQQDNEFIPKLTVTKDTVVTDQRGGEATISIISNVKWNVVVNDAWITCDPLADSANSYLHIHWDSSTVDSFRSGSLTVTGEGLSPKTITIIQQYAAPTEPLKLLRYSGSDSVFLRNDSIFLLFNKPITVHYVVSATQIYSLDAIPQLIENGYGFEFYCSYLALGDTFAFKYEVTSDDGESIVDTLHVKFYSRKIDHEGQSLFYFVSDDNTTLWTTFTNPNRIEAFSMIDGTLIKNLPLSFTPGIVRMNPYNHLLYITHLVLANKIEVYDPVTLQFVKTIIIPLDDQMNATYPTYYPQSIAFASNGYGLLGMADAYNSGSCVRIIDAAHNDSIYYDDDVLPMFPQGVMANYDYSKLIVEERWGNVVLKIIDATTHQLSTLNMQAVGNCVFAVPSRKENKIFAAGIHYQAVYNLDGSHSPLGNLFVFATNSADFSYSPSDEDRIYYTDAFNHFFEWDDYDQQQTLFYAGIHNSLIDLLATTDGKSIIMRGLNSIFIIDTRMFR